MEQTPHNVTSSNNAHEQPKRPAYSVTNPDHKFYFCHFANMAEHNAFIVINEIAKQVEVNVVEEEGKTKDSHIFQIEYRKDPVKYGRAMDLLQKHFRFMKHLINKEDPDRALKHLQNILKDLHTHRNFFSHYLYNEIIPNLKEFKVGAPGEESISLAYLFRQAVMEARKRLIAISDDDFAEIFDETKNQENETVRKYKYHFELDANKRTAFFLCLFLEKKDGNELISKIEELRGTNENRYIASRESFTQFWCVLPHRPLESGELGLEILNELNKIPTPLYDAISGESKKAFEPEQKPQENEQVTVMRRHEDRFPYFALRFFEEMDFIPGMRFHHYLGQLCLRQTIEPVNGTMLPRRLVKDINAFASLAQYQQGRGITDLWKKEHKVAERLFLNDKELLEQALKKSKEENSGGRGIIAFAPRYRLNHNGKIGIILQDIQKPEWLGWKTKKEENDIAYLVLSESKYAKSDNPERPGKLPWPNAVISTRELPNLFLYAWLHREGKIEKSPADFIKGYLVEIKRCIDEIKGNIRLPVIEEQFTKRAHEAFSEEEHKKKLKKVQQLREMLQKEYGLKPSDLPDIVREYMLGYTYPSEKQQLIAKLERHLEMADAYLKESKALTKLEKGRKKGLTAGKIGTRLARDFITFQTREKKPNDSQFNILQEYIAYFGKNIEPLDMFLKKLKITDKGNHLILRGTVRDYQANFNSNAKKKSKAVYSVKHFYEDYLGHKKEYLSNAIEWIGKEKLAEQQFSLLYNTIFRIKQKPKEGWNYDGLHVRLPRGIFNKAIAEAVKDEIEPTGKHIAVNPSFIIERKINALQKFYTLKREYMVKQEPDPKRKGDKKYMDNRPKAEFKDHFMQNTLEEIRNRSKETTDKDQKKLLETLCKKIEANEKNIRYAQYTDRVLWQMVKLFYTHKYEHRAPEEYTYKYEKNREPDKVEMNIRLENVSLKDIGADLEENNFMDTPVPMEQKIGNKTLVSIQPIREYGLFRRFQLDRRLPNLFSWFETETNSIPKDAILEELKRYDIRRDEFLKVAFEFEKVCGKDERFKFVITKWLQETGRVDQKYLLEKYDELYPTNGMWNLCIHIRNKFAHNEFPYYSELKDNDAIKKIKESQHNFIEQITTYFIEKYENFITQLTHG